MNNISKVVLGMGLTWGITTGVTHADVLRPSEAPQNAIGVLEVTAENLFLRSAPSYSAPELRTLHAGETYIVYGEQNGLYDLGNGQWTSSSPKFVKYEKFTDASTQATPKTGVATIKVDSLFVREAADFNAKAVKVVTKGQTFRVYGEQNGLLNVGNNEWISAGSTFVDFRPDGSAGTTVNETRYVDAGSSNLNIRSGAGTNYSILTSVSTGTKVTLLETIGSWGKVSVNGVTGYAHTDYLTAKDTSGSTSGNTNVGTRYVNTNGSNLNVRTGPGTNYGIASQFGNGTAVNVYSTTGSWAKVSANGVTGFVHTDYLSDSKTTNGTNEGNQTETRYVDAGSSNLNIRSGAGTNYGVVTKATTGTKLTVNSISGSWAKVTVNGVTGYAHVDFLSKNPVNTNNNNNSNNNNSGNSGNENTSIGVRYVDAGGSSLNIRTGPGTGYDVVTKVQTGGKVDVYSISGSWAKVNANGKTGYAHVDFLSKDPVNTNTTNPNNNNNGNTTNQNNSGDIEKMFAFAKQFIGMPYVWGGSNPSTSFDCSGFIYYVMKNNGHPNLWRDTVAGYWKIVDRVSSPKPGDLVFFKDTYSPGYNYGGPFPSHIGIVLDYEGNFIQSGEPAISIRNYKTNSYWSNHLLGFGNFR